MNRAALNHGDGPPCLLLADVAKSHLVNGSRRPALEGISLSLARESFLGVVGPSGCGKTTLLNLIAGFLAPDRGRVEVEGRPVTGPGPDRAVVFQEDALFPWLTVEENIAMGLARTGLSRRKRRQKVAEFLGLVGLAGQGSLLPGALSGGMKQRVALARVLVLKPRLLLMDEPFAALDAQTREEMHRLTTSLSSRLGQTVVMVTHDIEEAIKLSDRVLLLSGSPGRTRREFAVGMPRPRDTEGPAFLALKKEIRAGLSGVAR